MYGNDKVNKIKLIGIGSDKRDIYFVMKKNKHLIKQKGLLMPVVDFLNYTQYVCTLFPTMYFNPKDVVGMMNEDLLAQHTVSYKATLIYYIFNSDLTRDVKLKKTPIFDCISGELTDLYIFINTQTLKNMESRYFNNTYHSSGDLIKKTKDLIEQYKTEIKNQRQIKKEMLKYFIN